MQNHPRPTKDNELHVHCTTMVTVFPQDANSGWATQFDFEQIAIIRLILSTHKKQPKETGIMY